MNPDVPPEPFRGLRLERQFFEQSPVVCARALVGCFLEWGDCVGRVVETEAYAAEGDAACHTAFRPSARAFVEKHPAGTAYVYLNYGMHWMLNVLVKGPAGHGFVLLRALEPRIGVEAMGRRRKGARNRRDFSNCKGGNNREDHDGPQSPHIRQLCSGPGKLAQALGVTGADHGWDLCSHSMDPMDPMDPTVSIEPKGGVALGDVPTISRGFWRGLSASLTSVQACSRIGIQKAQELPWRFVEAGSPWVSVAPR